MSNKSTTDLYVNVHGLSKLKNLNKELRKTADFLLGITEYAKYLKKQEQMNKMSNCLLIT